MYAILIENNFYAVLLQNSLGWRKRVKGCGCPVRERAFKGSQTERMKWTWITLAATPLVLAPLSDRLLQGRGDAGEPWHATPRALFHSAPECFGEFVLSAICYGLPAMTAGISIESGL
jgi:hypothetical protein